MQSLLTVSGAQDKLREQVKAMRLKQGLTQHGLAVRAGVPVPTLRKFEQKGLISLEAFLKILMVLGQLETIVDSLITDEEHFGSIDDVLKGRPQNPRKRGWRS